MWRGLGSHSGAAGSLAPLQCAADREDERGSRCADTPRSGLFPSLCRGSRRTLTGWSVCAAAKKGRSRHARRQMSQLARLASISLAIIAPAAAASPMRYVPLDRVPCCSPAAGRQRRRGPCEARCAARLPCTSSRLARGPCVVRLACLSPGDAVERTLLRRCFIFVTGNPLVAQACYARSGPAFGAIASSELAAPQHGWCAGPWRH